ncbi:glycoside hydrolase family 13 protein [Micrococcales bacterium 31B]|nr:glycoside hydrolase family 13 protein [Micrococcales bacterium 31B]
MTQEWWRDAVIYQVYPRSFADANGDGMGDLPGITEKMPYLGALGVDAIWLSPFMRSPMRDAGYDVADYCDVDPLFGTLADFDDLVAAATQHGIKLIVDLVPNHSSSEHEFFKAALAAGPGSPERDLYVFKDGLGPEGNEPPTDWLSHFEGIAWTRVTEADGTPGQWYLHLFDPSQPDWNWENPKVHEYFESVLRFWLDRGVGGFRVDVAHALFKDQTFPSWPHHPHRGNVDEAGNRAPQFDRDELHPLYRRWREILDEYEGDRMMVAEASVTPDRLWRYLRADEMHEGFNFEYMKAPFEAEAMKRAIDLGFENNAPVGAPNSWVLSNHDAIRHATKMGYPAGTTFGEGILPSDPQPDADLGLRRARAATLFMHGLPGAVYVYQGEELGLPEHTTLAGEFRQDPSFERSGGTRAGRDGCRVPLPWQASAPYYGFSSGGSWLPQPESFAAHAADVEAAAPDSTLNLYRSTFALRKQRGLGVGTHAWIDGLPAGVLGYVNNGVAVIVNTTGEAQALPAPFTDAEVLLASVAVEGGHLAADSAAWLAA